MQESSTLDLPRAHLLDRASAWVGPPEDEPRRRAMEARDKDGAVLWDLTAAYLTTL